MTNPNKCLEVNMRKETINRVNKILRKEGGTSVFMADHRGEMHQRMSGDAYKILGWATLLIEDLLQDIRERNGNNDPQETK